MDDSSLEVYDSKNHNTCTPNVKFLLPLGDSPVMNDVYRDTLF